MKPQRYDAEMLSPSAKGLLGDYVSGIDWQAGLLDQTGFLPPGHQPKRLFIGRQRCEDIF
jgi:hypothetical protein